MLSIYLLIPLSLMLFVVAIWAIWYAVKSNQFEDLDNAPEQIILDDRQERRKILKKIHENNIPAFASMEVIMTASLLIAALAMGFSARRTA